MKDYRSISPTAATILELRALLNAPYAKELSRLCRAYETTTSFYTHEGFSFNRSRFEKLALWSTMRLFAMKGAIDEVRPGAVLEIASGVSPLSLMVTEDPNIKYVESDLAPIWELKRDACAAITATRAPRTTLLHRHLNALDDFEFRDLIAAERLEGATVVCEGLLTYLDRAEKQRLAQSIWHAIRANGSWITPDIVVRSELAEAFATDSYNRQVHELMTVKTGCDMVDLAWESREEAVAFFEAQGFSVRRYAQSECAQAAGFEIEADALSRRLRSQEVWIMRAR